MTKRLRILGSLTAMAAGWAGGFAVYAGWSVCCTAAHRTTDQVAMLFWSGVFVLVSWLFVALPVALLVAETSRLFRPLIATPFGALVGIASLIVFAGWTGVVREPLFIGYAAVVGAIAGIVYATIVTLSIRRRSG